MTKETPTNTISEGIAIQPVSRILDEGFHPKGGTPISTTPTVYGEGKYARTEFPGVCHPAGEAKTLELFNALQSVFGKADNIHLEPRLWHDRTFSDFSIVVDGKHDKLPIGIANVLADECKGKPSRHAER